MPKKPALPSESRRIRILEQIRRSPDGVVSISQLSQALSVSEMTIRRDLDWLAERRILARVHGGAVAYPGAPSEPAFGDRLNDFNPQKQAIGWAAAQLVKDGERIILDAGTTTRHVARNLAVRQGLTILTNNLVITQELAELPEFSTILLGGQLKHRELCTVGEMVKDSLRNFAVDRCFLSASGFDLQGAYDPDLREVEVKRAMLQAARQVILVADSSKFGLTALVRIAPLASFHQLVTDDNLPADAQSALEAMGLEVITPARVAAKIVATETQA